MALNYGVQVLGIDNIEEHTESALKRNKKLSRLWPSSFQFSGSITKSSSDSNSLGT